MATAEPAPVHARAPCGPHRARTAQALLQRGARALRQWWRLAVSASRLAIGVPDYDTYVEHLRRHHPEREPMSYEAFFAERLAARYAKGRSRCC